MATFNNGESGLSVRTKINNVLQHADGTASELVINDAGADVNFRVESDTNANALFVDGGTGNVGIGTSSPTGPLTVANSSNTLMALDADSNRGRLRLYRSGASAYTQLWHNGTDADWSATTGNLLLTAGGSERMRITSTGNVGIGTSAPAATLDVNAGSVSEYFRGAGNSGAARYLVISASTTTNAGDTHTLNASSGSGVLRFATAGVERMRIDSSGNVGIGTTAPAARLDLGAYTGGLLNTNILTAQDGWINVKTSASVSGSRYEYGASGYYGRIYSSAFGLNIDTGTSAVSLIMGTNNAERMRITSTGIVTINGTGDVTGLDGIAGAQIGDGSSATAGLALRTASTSYMLYLGSGSTALQVYDSAQNTERMRITSTGLVGIGDSNPSYRLDVNGAIGFTPGASVTPVSNGDVVFELTNNTTLTVKAKGSDGVVRSATLTLA